MTIDSFSTWGFFQHRKTMEKYTFEEIINTKDPEILTEVLKREENDWSSGYAACNRSCSPEILAEVLRRGNNNGVSWNAAVNPNCPPEVLAEVLRRGKDDMVSRHAAKNPNCPPEVLAEVLKKENGTSIMAAFNSNTPSEALAEILRIGNNDKVSWHAAFNPNCPPKSRIDWLEATNQLTKYNPEIHELEKTPIDKDLEELRKLLYNDT